MHLLCMAFQDLHLQLESFAEHCLLLQLPAETLHFHVNITLLLCKTLQLLLQQRLDSCVFEPLFLLQSQIVGLLLRLRFKLRTLHSC